MHVYISSLHFHNPGIPYRRSTRRIRDPHITVKVSIGFNYNASFPLAFFEFFKVLCLSIRLSVCLSHAATCEPIDTKFGEGRELSIPMYMVSYIVLRRC